MIPHILRPVRSAAKVVIIVGISAVAVGAVVALYLGAMVASALAED